MPEVTTAPAPAAPAAAAPPTTTTAAPAAPAAKTPAQTSGPVSKPAANLDDAYSQLEALGNPPVEPKKEDGTEGVNDAKAKADAEAKAKADTEGNNDADKGKNNKPPVKAGTLRENYDRLKVDLDAANARLKEYETERAKLVDPKEHPEFKKVNETLTAKEKRLAELEEELKFTAFERSDEYKNTFEKPFIDAYGVGRAKVASLTVTEQDGTERAGTAADFDRLMRITDDGDAAQAAFDLFGNKAAIVMFHREKVQEKNNARVSALEEFRTKGTAREKQRTEERQTALKKTTEEASNIWRQSVSQPHEKFPEYFKPVEGDAKGNELLEKGFARASRAFQVMNVLDPALTPEQRQAAIRDHAVVFNKAAAFDRVAMQKAEMAKRVKELEAKVAAYEASEPGGGTGGGKRNITLTTQQQVDQALQRLAK